MEMRDTSVRGEKALADLFPFPLIVGIPFVLTASERRARQWRLRIEWVAASMMIVAMLVAEAYVFRKG